jgi:hypothetical protein
VVTSSEEVSEVSAGAVSAGVVSVGVVSVGVVSAGGFVPHPAKGTSIRAASRRVRDFLWFMRVLLKEKFTFYQPLLSE